VTSRKDTVLLESQLLGFKRHLRAEVVPGEATYLFSERGVTAIQGRRLEEIAPLLDGTRDLSTLLSQAPEGGSPQQVGQMVDQLTRAGLVEWRDPEPEPDRESLAAEVYWGLAGLNTVAARSRVANGRINLVTMGAVDADSAAAVLSAGGISVLTGGDGGPSAEQADITVVLCDDYLADELAGIDAEHRASGRPWLLAKPEGAEVWIGPVFQPGGGCWHCLAHRLRGHRQAETHVQRSLGRTGPAPRPVGRIPALDGLGTRLAALEAVKWLAGYRYEVQQAVWVLDSLGLGGGLHRLQRRPQCSACGDPGLLASQVGRPFQVRSRPKVHCAGNDHRAATPEQVLAEYSHLVSPVTGVVKAIRRDPRGPAFLNCFRSGPNVAAGLEGLSGIRSGLRNENAGKGVTAVHAEVSALCEALERHSAYFHGDEPRVRESYRALGDVAVHPDTCQLYDERQFRDRERWNAVHGQGHWVREPFEEDTPIDWTPVWSLTEQRQRLLPTAMLYFNTPMDSGRRFVGADSNGNASGSSLEYATVHWLLELAEREAASLWR
jgi:ribosomal protein S12 methylthiotransferase accessory factor